MALYSVKPRFRQLLAPLATRLRWIHPDAITAAGFGASVAAWLCLLAADETRWLLLLVPGWLFARLIFNALDGLIAQMTGRARPFGEVLNEGVDRLSDVVLLFGLGVTSWASVRWAAVATVVVLLSSYAGLLGKAAGVGREYGGLLGKADRMVWLGVAALIAWATGPRWLSIGPVALRWPFEVMLAAFVLLAALTILQRVWAIRERLARFRGGG